MRLNCRVGEDSWEFFGLQGEPTSPFWRTVVSKTALYTCSLLAVNLEFSVLTVWQDGRVHYLDLDNHSATYVYIESSHASLQEYIRMLWVLGAQSCLTLCNPLHCGPSASSVHGILQARILEWVSISFSRGYSWLRNRAQTSCIASGYSTIWTLRVALR